MKQSPLIAAGLLMGVGMGGFVDGILFHQILQLHNMLSAKVPPDTLINAKVNMVWDGLFHAVTWLMTPQLLRCSGPAARSAFERWCPASVMPPSVAIGR